jgi:hypothetical protein
MITHLLGGGPGNKRDRERFANLDPTLQVLAGEIAFRLYDGTRTVARCWSLALDEAERSR